MPDEKTEKKEEAATIRPAFSLNDAAKSWLRGQLCEIEEVTGKDALTICGGIFPGADIRARIALEEIQGQRQKKKPLLVILHTNGGIVEEVANIVKVLRRHYDEVHFLVPMFAMSAGTVLAMSGDKIYMDYFSRLGPIDPQIRPANREYHVPALSYLHQYEDLIKREGALTMAELTLLNKLDLAELHGIRLAADLSVSLIKDWLTKHKLRLMEDGKPVPANRKAEKAQKIADALGDQKRWFSHSYSIHKDILEKDLGLAIDDYSEDGRLKKAVWQYLIALLQYIGSEDGPAVIHSREFL